MKLSARSSARLMVLLLVTLAFPELPGRLAAAAVFSNPAPITINDDPDGAPPGTAATPYPSSIVVSGLAGTVKRVKVTITNLSHTLPQDVDILLVGPGGQTVLLMSDAGCFGSSNVTLTFADAAAAEVPECDDVLPSGTFKPSNYSSNGSDDSFPGPAPPGPYGATLSVFNGTDPNGTWSLFVIDEVGGDAGEIAGGWSLNIRTHGDITVTPLSVDFGPVPVGGKSALELVTVENAGGGQLTIGTITKDGANPDQFRKPAAHDGCSGQRLVATQSCTVGVRFKPTDDGPQSATLVIPSNDPDEDPVAVTLSGTGLGPEISVTPPSVDFGPVPVGGRSALELVTVENAGPGDLTIGTITKGGADPDQFKKPATRDGCSGQTLAATESCTVGVRFKPTNNGLQSATLVIPSNDPDEPAVTVPLSGTGTP